VYNWLNYFGSLTVQHLCIQKIIVHLQKPAPTTEIVRQGITSSVRLGAKDVNKKLFKGT
jgi:hypothetical protein